MDQNPAQPVSPTPPSPTPNPAPVVQNTQIKTGPKLATVLPWVLVVIFLGITGFLAYQNYLLNSKINSLSYTAMPTATPAFDLTANWKTYTHSKFAFKYPSDVKLVVENPDAVTLLKNMSEPQTEATNGINIQFAIPTLINNMKLEELVDQLITDSKENSTILVPKQKIVLNGYSGFTYTTKGLGTQKYIFLQSPFNPKVYMEIIDATQDPQSQGYRTTADQILSTFKFTDNKEACVSGFTLYNDSFLSLCYPSDMTYTKDSHSTPDKPNDNNAAETINFESAAEKIVVNTSFTGGWGGGSCSYETKTLNGLQSTFITYDQEGGSQCTDHLVNLIGVIGENKRTGNLPVALDYQRKGTQFLSRVKFDNVMNSIKIK